MLYRVYCANTLLVLSITFRTRGLKSEKCQSLFPLRSSIVVHTAIDAPYYFNNNKSRIYLFIIYIYIFK